MKRKLTSLIALLLILCTCLATFTACNNSTENEEGNENTSTSNNTPALQTSPGLAYIINEDGVTASIIGIGTCNNAQVVIGDSINGYPITTIFPSAFVGNAYILSVIISDQVTYIGQHAFENCINLTTVTLPKGITEIYNNTFSGCKNLDSINIPGSVKKIGEKAFYNCTKITKVHADSVKAWCNIQFANQWANPLCENAALYIDGAPVTNLVISDVYHIYSNAFYGCNSITSVTISDSVVKIDDSAFSNCTNLKTVSLPSKNIEIGKNVFYASPCFNSDTYRPSNVMYIGKHLIDAKDFYWNNNYDDMTYKYTVRDGTITIAADAFQNCKAISSVILPDSVQSIGDDAFSSCENLTSITIPKSVRSIGFYAFAYSYKLSVINYTGTEEEWNSISGLKFANIPNGVTINFNYVP